MRKLFTALFFSSVCANCALAQQHETNYHAIHWGLNEGLSQGETYHMIKDVNGFLWIGTRYGLNRFDGNSFKVYTHERNNNKSLISNDVLGGLVEDSLHNIWIGSDVGLSRYNINTGDFTNFYPDTIFNDDPEITPFWATKKEVFCMESESLITAYDIRSSVKKVIGSLGNHKKKIIGIATTYSIFDSNTNSVWCLIEDDVAKSGLLQVMLSTGDQNFFPFSYKRKKMSQGFAEDMCYDAVRKCIWVNSTEGLLQFTLADKQFHHINALYKYEQQKNYTRFVGIALDKQHRVWFTTDPKGIIIYNPADESVSFPFPGDSATQHDVSDANAFIYCDQDNTIWSGFWLRKGIYALVPYLPVVKYYAGSPMKDALHSSFVVTTVDAGKGKIWVGTQNGINILDKKTGTFHTLQEKDFQGIQTQDGFIAPVAIDTLAQKAWLFTRVGYFKADMFTKKCTPIFFEDFNRSVTPAHGVSKFDGKKIFFTNYPDGAHVYVLNLNNDTAHEILSFPGFLFNVFNTIPTKNHFLFLQGNTDERDNQTYENKNGKWVRIQTPIDSIRWTSIAYIKENDSYWVAAEKQLLHFDNSFRIIKTYSIDNGLSELPITGLINDNNGNMWFHTDRSIQELNVATGQIKTLSEIDGFEKQNFELLSSVSKDADGNIYYCGGVYGDGFDKISPGNFISAISSVYLKSLNINGRPFSLNASINYTDTLSLNHNQTKIEIETGIVDFYSRGKSRLRYKLEGKGRDEHWQYAPYYYTIRYDGLQPGNYKLIMQASNVSNEFTGQEKILWINIHTAWWQAWWFITTAVFLAVIVFYSFLRWRFNQKYRLRLSQSEKEKQLAELKEKAAQLEMEILRSQMNPHFIFNCLSSINSFILKNKTEEASNYLTKFSRLIRMALNNSKKPFISLEDELETLHLYLDMEKLRFKNSFDYAFNLPDTIEVENVFVPPLLLQPLAENAIWHGLMHKDERGFLNFDFDIQEKILTCVITDNGVGREKAEMLKSKFAAKQKSLGLKITTERLSLLNNHSDKQTFFTIEDLKDENGHVSGTRVYLKIHFKEIIET